MLYKGLLFYHLVGAFLLQPSRSFSPALKVSSSRFAYHTLSAGNGVDDLSFFEKASEAVQIFQRSRGQGDNFKQSIADAMAGDYDRESAAAEIDALITSKPVVIFTWASSPFSKKALEWLKVAGYGEGNDSFREVRLDNPWSKGNPLRAELGRRTGRTSVPSVWIDGKYCGGFDDGPSEEAPGLMKLAFTGQLLEKLERAASKGTVEKESITLPITAAETP